VVSLELKEPTPSLPSSFNPEEAHTVVVKESDPTIPLAAGLFLPEALSSRAGTRRKKAASAARTTGDSIKTDVSLPVTTRLFKPMDLEATVGFSRRNTGYREIHRSLLCRGFIEDHTTGDHVIYTHGKSSISVPRHKVLKTGLLHSLAKQISDILHSSEEA
jgi:predicted RNA binding protein YcfA (HicA-like mRNA interferase family)